MNIYLIIVLTILLVEYLLTASAEILNLKALKADIPAEFKQWYDLKRYSKSQDYLKENTHFKIIKDTISLIVFLVFILVGGFNFVDQIARNAGSGVICTGLFFAGLLFLFFQIIEVPFSAYHTFVIEQKYGFNRTSVKTFIQDIVKGWALTVIIGTPVFAFIIWFFLKSGNLAWMFCWLAVTLVELFVMFIAPVVIMPLFNKFVPLEESQLKTAITNYARSENFRLNGIFKMDGSRRSAKSNAFFTGFGRFRRIVLFDTLIEKQTTEELVSVLAHEVGHYKKKHILKFLMISVLANGIMFFMLSFFINNATFLSAFKIQNISVYASLCLFGFLYSPINLIFSLLTNFLSRKHEYQADCYAVSTFNHSESFITALKKLSVDNLSNLNPHPWKVFLSYSHPPVLLRINAIRRRNDS